jgi:hypothetical protein
VFNSNLKPRTSNLALLLLVFTLAACGGDNNSPAPTPTTGAAVTPTSATSEAAVVTPSADACYQAVDKLAQAKSFHFVYTETQTVSVSGFGAATPGQSGGSGSFSVEGDADLASRAWHYTASDSRAERSEITGEWIHIQNKAYHKVGGGWATPSPTDALPLTINSKLSQIASSLPPANQIEFLGVETVASQESSHCQFASDAKAPGGAATYDLWASNRSGALLRIVANHKSDSFSLILSKLDQPVSIVPPQ